MQANGLMAGRVVGRGCCVAGLVALVATASAQVDKYAYYGLGPDGQPLLPSHTHTAGPTGRLFAESEDDLPADERLRRRIERGLTLAVNPFPAGMRVEAVTLRPDNVIELRLHLPADWLAELAAGTTAINKISHPLGHMTGDLPIDGVELLTLHPETGAWVEVGSLAKDDSPVADSSPDTASLELAKALEAAGSLASPSQGPERASNYPRPSGGRPTGGLSNRVVYLNAGHGWTWRSSESWGLQRGFVFNNIEDMSNTDTVHSWVWPYLYRAGADVFTVREQDPNPNMVIVDNDGGSPDYVETGSWSTSSVTGFRNGEFPYVQGENPFSFGTQRIAQCAVGAPTATATYIPTIPAAGFYNVYVSYAAYDNRATAAHYRITHAGGDTDYYINQRRYRNTWIFIGRYFFEAGRDANAAKVVLLNDSSSNAHFIAADAVRFGGGTGIISRGTVGASPYPNRDNEAIYHMQFMGAPTSVYQSSGDDEATGWSGRPEFGEWLEQTSVAYAAPSIPAVYLSNHTNAASGTARGPISILYTGYTGTEHDRFRNAVHARVHTNWSQGYGGAYVANGNPLRTGNYGENNPNNVNQAGYPTVPIFLGEWLFHDNASDMGLYHDPKFRRMLGRGIYQGIVDYWAAEIGGPSTYLPEPPRNLRVTVTSPTQVTLTWAAPLSGRATGLGDAATAYKVYRSTHGRGFAGGTANASTSVVVSGLTPGTTHYFQVTATNAGGESFPTETLACKLPIDGTTPKLLIVNGFDKLDVTQRVQTPYSGSTLYRQWVDSMNTMDYIVEHGRAIDASGHVVAVDSVEHDAVEANLVTLSNYAGVIWIGGEQAEVSTADPGDDSAMKTNSRTALTNYLNGGGKLFATGAEVAWDLNRLSQTTFLNNTLRTAYVAENAQTVAEGVDGSIFDGLAPLTFGTGTPYPVELPDTLNTAGGSTSAMVYGSASGTTLIDAFDAIGGWQAPSFSGQTTADSSTFGIAGSPVRQGTGSGNLGYNWTLGTFIREYNSALPQFPAASDFGIWVHGDNSGHQVRITLRDTDNELYVNPWTTINFNGWQQITWNDIVNNPGTRWAGSGNNIIEGPNVRLDSIQIQQVGGGPVTGNIYFDEATYTPTGGGGGGNPIAAIQYDGTAKVVVMGFPFETIVGASNRTAVMDRVLDFFFAVPTTSDGMRVY